MRRTLPIIIMLLAFAGGQPVQAAPRVADEAERIYKNHGDAVYQVQVIDEASARKSSIGSGFQFTADGLIATNYHVVAEAIQRPGESRLEYLRDDGAKGTLQVVTADVVNDLAILKMDPPGESFITLGTSKLPKGAKIFALGNPRDIGFTIIDGTYNGVSRESFIDKIHFSGSLNPGMSGGPALSHDGQVTGINVSTAGNQISFLVPVEPLKKLADEYLSYRGAENPFMKNPAAHIEKQLARHQSDNIARLDAEKWETLPFYGFLLPGRIDPAFKCWGGAAHGEKDPYTYHRSTCTTQESRFIDEDPRTGDMFTTGTYTYRYDAMEGKRNMNLARFYNFYEQQYSMPLEDYANGGEKDVTNFKCNNRFIRAAGETWKASFCVRQYRQYRSLFDMHLYMALVDAGKKGLLLSYVMQGVTQDNAARMAAKFIGEIRPAPKPARATKPVDAKKPAKAPAAESAVQK